MGQGRHREDNVRRLENTVKTVGLTLPWRTATGILLGGKQKVKTAAQNRGSSKRGGVLIEHYRTWTTLQKSSAFACALVRSPERMAGQTACPEESLARARKRCRNEHQ